MLLSWSDLFPAAESVEGAVKGKNCSPKADMPTALLYDIDIIQTQLLLTFLVLVEQRLQRIEDIQFLIETIIYVAALLTVSYWPIRFYRICRLSLKRRIVDRLPGAFDTFAEQLSKSSLLVLSPSLVLGAYAFPKILMSCVLRMLLLETQRPSRLCLRLHMHAVAGYMMSLSFFYCPSFWLALTEPLRCSWSGWRRLVPSNAGSYLAHAAVPTYRRQ